jgi:hypothetical protein
MINIYHTPACGRVLNLEDQDQMKQNTIEGKLLLEQVTESKSYASRSNEATSSMPAVIAVTQRDPTQQVSYATWQVS